MRTKDVIATRQSCRAYKPEQISQLDLDILLQAANAAPIAKGEKNKVKLTVVQDPELLSVIDKEGGKVFGNPSMHTLYGAPTLIIVSGLANTSLERDFSLCNASCIIENMALAATDIKLGSVYIMGATMAIRQNAEICEALKIPEGFMPCASLAVGKPVKEPVMKELVTDKLAVDYI